MLVHYVASTLQMIRRHDRVNATRAMPAVLPRAKTHTQQQEPQSVAASDTLNLRQTPVCHPGSAQRYPVSMVSARHPLNGSRLSASLRSG